jgi:glycosyltransferase involved in cell wall biosynthesis
MVGTLEPRKGHRQILEAFEHLWSKGEDVKLVIVGRNGWLMEDFMARLEKHPEKGKKLFWLTGVSDEFLAKIYEACSCLLAASIDEGFGLPLIEAMHRGKPVLARDMEVFREIGGSHVNYFKENKDRIADCIKQTGEKGAPNFENLNSLNKWVNHVERLKEILLKRRSALSKVSTFLALVAAQRLAETSRALSPRQKPSTELEAIISRERLRVKEMATHTGTPLKIYLWEKMGSQL